MSICWYCTYLHTLHSSAGNRSNIRSASRTQTRLPCSCSARQPGRCECSSHTRSHLQSKSTALFSWAPKCNILTQSQGRKWKVTVHPMKLMEKQAGETAVWKKQSLLCVSISCGTHKAFCFTFFSSGSVTDCQELRLARFIKGNNFGLSWKKSLNKIGKRAQPRERRK